MRLRSHEPRIRRISRKIPLFQYPVRAQHRLKSFLSRGCVAAETPRFSRSVASRSRGDDASTGTFKILRYVERNQGLVLDDKDQAPRKTRHDAVPSAASREECTLRR